MDEHLEPAAPDPPPLEFPCPECNARTSWDPEADALLCEYCGTSTPVPRQDGTVLEYTLEEAGTAARGLGLEVRVAECRNCGARVTFEAASTSTACVFCGSPNVMGQEANRNAIRPESLVPMDVAQGHAQASVKKWIGGLWFRPNALKRIARFGGTGVYVPFWTFDCHVRSEWSADAGYYYYVDVPTTVMVDGKRRTEMRKERRTRWEPAFGRRADTYDDLLVNASHAVPDKLAQRLGGFDTGALVAYRPEYVAGWRAEEYQLDLEQGWERGRGHVLDSQRSRCARDVPGDTHRRLHVHNTVSGVRWKHVLLPIWTLTYEHGGKHYRVLVNGQSGRVHGEAPLSWPKILLFVLAVIGALLLLVVLTGGAVALGALLGLD